MSAMEQIKFARHGLGLVQSLGVKKILSLSLSLSTTDKREPFCSLLVLIPMISQNHEAKIDIDKRYHGAIVGQKGIFFGDNAHLYLDIKNFKINFPEPTLVPLISCYHFPLIIQDQNS